MSAFSVECPRAQAQSNEAAFKAASNEAAFMAIH